MPSFVFWQLIVSPHMAGLASALAASGADVTYVATRPMSDHRARLGWAAPVLPGVNLELHADAARVPALAARLPRDAIHVTEGVRRNGYVQSVIAHLAARGARWGAYMETVDDRGVRGALKRLDYRWALSARRARPDFVLAIGHRTPGWVAARRFPASRVLPFSYFLEPHAPPREPTRPAGPFRVGFVGNLIRRKRVDLLVAALSRVARRADFELAVVGGGPLEESLKELSRRALGADRVRWLGSQPRSAVLETMRALDCLVLPSDHDGWGAVVTEALLAGVPAICSDACGSAVAVKASRAGGVFRAGDAGALGALLEDAIRAGPDAPARRLERARWATCFGTRAGAAYLARIARHVYDGEAPPSPPWTAPEEYTA